MKSCLSQFIYFCKEYSGLIFAIFLFSFFVIVIPNKNYVESSTSVNRKMLDSLNSIIYTLEQEINSKDYVIDSLKRQTPKIIIKYEKEIGDIADVNVVSDDSITKYIRAKLSSI